MFYRNDHYILANYNLNKIFYFLLYFSYIKKETATFFGVDEETEALEKQRWFDRRRRMASRKYGALHPEHKPPDPDITRDVPDSTEAPEVGQQK